VTPVLWDLLESGEVRLIKQFFTVRMGTGQFLGISTQTVDVVRWGGFMPTVDMLPVDPIYPNPGPELLYPQNQPAGFIPEWWSLARYGDDVGASVDVHATRAGLLQPGEQAQVGISELQRTGRVERSGLPSFRGVLKVGIEPTPGVSRTGF
jgi:hypothetical protein